MTIRATLALFGVALAVFLLLPQRHLHGMDTDYFVVWIEQGQHTYARHVAYLHWQGTPSRVPVLNFTICAPSETGSQIKTRNAVGKCMVSLGKN